MAEPPCPACGRPRAVTATRHKVLGAWVPEWEVQPCRNPDCPLYEQPVTAADHASTGRASTGSGGREGEAAGGTEATTTQVTGKNGENGRSPATG